MTSAPVHDRPNVIVFVSHDTGRHLPSYGVKGLGTPQFDRLARESVRFAQAFSTAPLCCPARASIFTGFHPHEVGVHGLTNPRACWDLEHRERHACALFNAAGYETALAGYAHEEFGLGRKLPFAAFVPVAASVPKGRQHAIGAIAPGVAGWLSGRKDERPFFLQIGCQETHRGFLPKGERAPLREAIEVPAYLNDLPEVRQDLADFHASVERLDAGLGVVLEALDTNGLAENTLLLVLTDHGIDYPAAKGCCNAAGLGTFLFARWPGGGWRQGAVCADLVSHVDLLPTLVGPCGLNPPEALSGFDLGPALRDGQTVGRTEVFAGKTYHDCYDPTRSIRTERWSYVRYFDEVQLQDLRLGSLECSTFRKAGFLRENREELFDFAADPDETRNLAADPAHEDTRRRMLRKLRDWMEATGDPLLRGPVPSRVYAADMKVFRET